MKTRRPIFLIAGVLCAAALLSGAAVLALHDPAPLPAATGKSEPRLKAELDNAVSFLIPPSLVVLSVVEPYGTLVPVATRLIGERVAPTTAGNATLRYCMVSMERPDGLNLLRRGGCAIELEIEAGGAYAGVPLVTIPAGTEVSLRVDPDGLTMAEGGL